MPAPAGVTPEGRLSLPVELGTLPPMSTVSPTHQPQRVKAKFIGPFSIALLFIMMVFAVAIYGVEAHIRDRDLAERSAAVARLFSQKIGKDADLMMATLHAMMSNKAMEAAFRDGDRQELVKQGGSLYRALREEHRVTHLYFTRPDLAVLYRFHSPEEFGDKIFRVTTQQAKTSQAAAHGLELGPIGTLTLRLVMPWKAGNTLLGYVEIGEEIEHLINEVSGSLAVDLLVLVDKQYLAQQQWQRGQSLMHRAGEWDRFSTHVTMAQTTETLPADLNDHVLDQLLAGRTTEIRDRGRSLHLAVVPLDDPGGRHIGDLVMMRDITDLESTFLWSMVAVILISLLIAGGVLVVFYLALERVEHDYQRQHELEHRLLHLDTEHQRILQLEKLSALGTMVGGIAHQLNNPLVGVVNMAQLAEREAGDPARIRELLADIRRAGEDCRGFVRRMLEFTKVSSFESRPTPMAALIEDTVLMFRQTEERHLPVEVHLPDEPPVLTVDPILIRHALFNLLVNAAQATTGNAGISIRLEPQTDPASGAPGWSLSVADRGSGIAPGVMDKIFVPFFTTRSDGTGLGLPVVLHVALLHDGHVTATNRPDGGTQFAVWLPR